MANVNVNYSASNVIKPDQTVNSQYIQKILDENVGLIHAIIDKQQQNQEAEDLLKTLHKNLIYLATIADQTTSAGNTANSTSTPQHQYSYPQSTVAHPPLTNQNFPSNIPQQPMQSAPYVTQSSMTTSQSTHFEPVDKKPQTSGEDAYNEPNTKNESSSSINVDMDREVEKCHIIRESNQSVVPKNVDIDKESPITQSSEIPKEINVQNSSNAEYIQKFDENTSTTSSHIQNSNIKTDMPPPSQPIGMHQEKNSIQYPGNQRIMYPGVSPNYNQYSPHFDQNSKFYSQNMYQQSPYNYQGMYNPYNQPAAPPAAPNHFNQHMMNTSMYPQYPYYQQPGLEQMSPGPKDPSLPQQMHPANGMFPSNTMPQSMYPSQNAILQGMHPPNTISQTIKSQSNESLPPINSNIAD